MAAGLAGAFYNRRIEEEKEYRGASRSFYIAISALFIVSLLSIYISIHFLESGLSLIEVVDKLPRIVTGLLPIYLPLLWLAFSASKKRNLAKRLIEEYAHKEVLAKTFTGLAEQLNQHEEEETKRKLWNALLNNMIDVSAENSGKLISGFNDADHPMIELIREVFSKKNYDAVKDMVKS